MLLCLIMTAGSYARITRSEALAGSRMPVTARVTEEPRGHGAYTRLEVKTVDGGEGSAPSGIKLTVSVNGDDDAAFSTAGGRIQALCALFRRNRTALPPGSALFS